MSVGVWVIFFYIGKLKTPFVSFNSIILFLFKCADGGNARAFFDVKGSNFSKIIRQKRTEGNFAVVMLTAEMRSTIRNPLKNLFMITSFLQGANGVYNYFNIYTQLAQVCIGAKLSLDKS